MSVGWGDYFPLGYCGMTAQLSAGYQLPPEASEEPVYMTSTTSFERGTMAGTWFDHICVPCYLAGFLQYEACYRSGDLE